MVLSNSQWLANAGASYEIDQSIRFNDDDSAYLSRTPGSAGNRRTFTFSCWVKRANLTGANQPIFSAGGDDWLMFLSAETLGFNTSGSNYRIVTTQLFRDPGAWMHVVLRVDTTNSTAGDRLRLYLNGSEITDFGTDSNPTLNFETSFNNTGEHDIGKLVGASQFFDGYLAEINHVDGSSLAPSNFGETNDDGVWIPKAYDGSYGTNGFFIDGRDSSDLGDDESGNGNDFASSGLAAADQMPDTPTLNHWTLSPLDSGSTLANGNLQNKGGSSTNTHAPAFPKTGKWYVEIDCIDINTGTSGAHFFGICDASVPYSASFSDHAATSAGQQRGGQLQKNNSNTSSGTAVNDGDVIALAFDADNLTLDLYVNNSASGSQITGLTDVQYKLWIQDGGTVTNMQFNFAKASFEYTPPTGFKALSTANLPTPTVADGSKYFQPTLYTGTGSSRSVDQSGNSTFQPDWVWVKSRNAGYDHALYDAVRGVTKELKSNDSSAEGTITTGLTAFESDGFQVGSRVGVNGGSDSFVAWQWLANGAGSSNEDGSINTTATSVNTTAGFSISKYDGSGSNATVGHGLGIAPKMVIVKETTDSRSWAVYHEGIGDAAKVIFLDQNVAASTDAAVWNSTAPTSTVFSVGTANGSNGSGNTYIAYAFAEIPGYSSIGSYTGNGSTNGPFIYTNNMTPKWVITKRTNSTGFWDILDTTREPFNSVGNQIFADRSDAEASNDHEMDFLSNGIKIRDTSTSVNASGSTYIYMAFAEHPFGGDGAAPATAR